MRGTFAGSWAAATIGARSSMRSTMMADASLSQTSFGWMQDIARLRRTDHPTDCVTHVTTVVSPRTTSAAVLHVSDGVWVAQRYIIGRPVTRDHVGHVP